MTQIYISIGSNINKEHHINNALNALEAAFDQLVVSSVYQSEAVGFAGEDFFNLVVGAQTSMSLEQVVKVLKQIEQQNGRTRQAEKFSARTLDLDLLTFDDLVAETPAQIPRDEITKNAFVLWPLAEIAPNVTLPGTSKTFGQLWQAFDHNKQKLWQIPFNRK